MNKKHFLATSILLVTKHAGKQIVARRSEKAKQAGVWLGMSLTNARALAPEAQVYPFDIVYEENALYKLTSWAYSFSPLAVPDKQPTGNLAVSDPRYSGFSLDISGSKRIFGSYEKLLNQLSKELALLGFHSRLSVCPTLGAAWAFARYGEKRTSIINKQMLRSTLAPLSVTALRIPKEIERSLSELNISRVEHLFGLPRKTLLSRFGPILGKRLDQAFGIIDEAIEPIRVPPRLRVEKIFDGGLTQFDALIFNVCTLLKQLLDTLSAQQKKVSLLILEIKTFDNPVNSEEFQLAHPSCSNKHLWSLLQRKLENFNMGYGIEWIALSAPQQENIIPTKTSYIEEKKEYKYFERELGELLDSIQNSLGSESVCELQITASHIPEKAFSYRSLKKKKKRQLELPVLTQADRPSFMFSQPQPIRAMAALPDSPPHWLKWRGKKFRLKNGIGPERISPEWWQANKKESFGSPSDSCMRDYFKTQLPSGVWVWIFREIETSNWYIHGLWT